MFFSFRLIVRLNLCSLPTGELCVRTRGTQLLLHASICGSYYLIGNLIRTSDLIGDLTRIGFLNLTVLSIGGEVD